MKIKILHFVASIALTSFSNDVLAQQNCPEKITYEVSKLIMDGGYIPLAVFYYFQTDTLRVVSKNNDVTKPFSDGLIFNIVEKKCTWNKDFTEGESVYKLMDKLDDGAVEYSTLRVVIRNKSGQMFLQYEGEKERIFEMVIN